METHPACSFCTKAAVAIVAKPDGSRLCMCEDHVERGSLHNELKADGAKVAGAKWPSWLPPVTH